VQIGGICGDGERTPDEGCDDGNQNDGDSCSATCESEIVDLGTGGVFPAGFGAGQADFFSFVLAAPVEVDLSTDDGNGACPGDTNMLLLVQGPDGGFTPTAQSVTGPLDPCAALRQNLQPGTYVLVVNGPAAVPNYILRADLGAGILDLGAGGAFDRPGFAEGAADLLVMTIDAASTVTLFTGNIDGTPECVAGTDTFISLLDVDEDVIAEDDDADGRGLCSEVSADLQPGTYFLRVRGFNNGVVGPYRITSEILPL
jgi:cysteine-rich repeat protein